MKNNERINLLDIPTLDFETLRAFLVATALRPIAFFGMDWGSAIKLIVGLVDDEKGEILLSSSLIDKNIKEYESIAKDNHQYHMFEREFYEQFGVKPNGHPWLKPVRKNLDDYKFFEMEGEEVHQVAVGPIHAGVIEPGHFRFMCQGEKVYNLEIMLGYQHRNVEKLMLNPNNRLAESICGDSVIAYNIAYSQAMESLAGVSIPQRAELIRRIALEMERIAIHIGDMGAICGDMAYLMGSSIFGTTRTLVINTMLEICGSRFGRGLVDFGGVNFDINQNCSDNIKNVLKKVKEIVDRTAKVILKKPTCISRMEQTGIVSRDTAISLGAVGMAARSSGVNIDSRFDFKDKWYRTTKNKLEIVPTGDVYARFNLRYKEIRQSIKFVEHFLELLQNYSDGIKSYPKNLEANSFVVSIVEGWRGEVVHCAITGANSELIRYKIKDPSFNNWYMLAMAVRNNGISDFPLCNKSFNLSYCGNDL
jgi:Ni,Fe-hydrogenase III large subunit